MSLEQIRAALIAAAADQADEIASLATQAGELRRRSRDLLADFKTWSARHSAAGRTQISSSALTKAGIPTPATLRRQLFPTPPTRHTNPSAHPHTTTAQRHQNRLIRAWATEHGHTLRPNGAIPTDIRQAYHTANPEVV